MHPTHCRRLKFSAIFLCHFVRWPRAVDIQVKFYGDSSRGITPPSGEFVQFLHGVGVKSAKFHFISSLRVSDFQNGAKCLAERHNLPMTSPIANFVQFGPVHPALEEGCILKDGRAK